MTIPPECQTFADQIATLTSQEQAQFDALKGLSGTAKWKALEDLGTTRQQIAGLQTQLTACLKQYGSDLETTVVVMDVRGEDTGNRIGRVWQLTSAGQAVSQTSTVQAGTITFAGVLNSVRQSVGVTIEQIDVAAVNGPDFRSGALPSPAGPNDPDPVGRIEIVILDPIEITADTLTQSAPALPIQLTVPAGPAGTIGISVSAVNFVVEDGNVTLTAAGTVSVSGVASQFTFGCTVHLVPTFSMTPSIALDILTGETPSLQMSGIVGSVVETIAPAVSSNLLEQVLPPLRTLLNTLLAKRVAEILGIPTLHSGAVLSICELRTSGPTITITPALGAFGNVLSDFQPPALAPQTTLSSIAVQPSIIGTQGGSAQGTVNLFTPAPAGGITIQLSCSRTDVVNLTPTSLTIPEGSSSATFTAAAVAPPALPSTPIDCTLLASLQGQSVTTTLTVQPQQSSEVTVPSATPSPSSGSVSITDITLDDLITMPGITNTGRVLLSGPSLMSTIVTLTFSGVDAPAQDVLIPAGSTSGAFGFTYHIRQRASSQITASTDGSSFTTGFQAGG